MIRRSCWVLVTTLVMLCLFPGVATASGWVKQKMTTQFASKMMNRMAAAAGDGITEIHIHGDAKKSVTGNTGITTNFATGEVCNLNMKKKRANCTTIDRTREQMQMVTGGIGQMFGGGGDGGGAAGEGADEWEVSFDIQDLKEKATVNDFETTRWRWVITATRKGMSAEEGGAAIITFDLWVTDRELAVVKEIQAYDMRYAEAIGLPGGQNVGQLMRSMPGLGPAVEEMERKRKENPGTAVKTLMVFESIQGKQGGGGGQGGMAALKNMFGGGGGGNPGERSEQFRSTMEILAVGDSATAEQAGVPAGFKKKMP